MTRKSKSTGLNIQRWQPLGEFPATWEECPRRIAVQVNCLGVGEGEGMRISGQRKAISLKAFFSGQWVSSQSGFQDSLAENVRGPRKDPGF